MLRAGLRARRDMREQRALITPHAEDMRAVDARITTLVDSQLRAEEISCRNSEDINQLAEIVRQLATNRTGLATTTAHAAREVAVIAIT